MLRPYGTLIELHQQDLLEYTPPPEPVEFLFVDAMKSWALAQHIAERFFPLLIEGQAYVVQQDFAHFAHTVGATNHLIMWRLRGHFQPVHHVPHSSSVLFRCIREFSGQLPALSPESFSPEEVEAAYEYSGSCVSPKVRPDLEASKLAFLVEHGHAEPARRQLQRLARFRSRVPRAVFPELKRLIAQRRGMTPVTPTGPSHGWLDELDCWLTAHEDF